MPYAIEKNIPMPADAGSTPTASAPKYPFRGMEVGDSFAVATDKDRGRAMAAAAMHGCTVAGNGKRFASRKVEGGGYRIWRTA